MQELRFEDYSSGRKGPSTMGTTAAGVAGGSMFGGLGANTGGLFGLNKGLGTGGTRKPYTCVDQWRESGSLHVVPISELF